MPNPKEKPSSSTVEEEMIPSQNNSSKILIISHQTKPNLLVLIPPSILMISSIKSDPNLSLNSQILKFFSNKAVKDLHWFHNIWMWNVQHLQMKRFLKTIKLLILLVQVTVLQELLLWSIQNLIGVIHQKHRTIIINRWDLVILQLFFA